MRINTYFTIIMMVFIIATIGCGGEKKGNGATTMSKAPKLTPHKENPNDYKVKMDISRATPDFENGKKTYQKFCMACHFAGISGAQALQEGKYKVEEWQECADKGMETLLKHSIKGFNNNLMPPMGTCMNCSEKDMFDAISYMFKEAKVAIK